MVRFGQTEMTLLELTRIAPGSVIDLARSPDDPVDVLVHGRLVARGEVVVVSGNYGVRITDVISAEDRLRTSAPRSGLINPSPSRASEYHERATRTARADEAARRERVGESEGRRPAENERQNSPSS